MPPVSTHAPSPFVTADLSGDTVVVDGRLYRVQKLQSASFKAVEERDAARKKRSTSLSAYVKTLPEHVRKSYKLAKKIESFRSQGLAERKVLCELRKKKEEEFRETNGIKYINQFVRRRHKDALEPTSAEVNAELARLRAVLTAVERGFEGG